MKVSWTLQGTQKCPGSCTQLFAGRRCYHCHMALLARSDHEGVSYALDLGNAQ